MFADDFYAETFVSKAGKETNRFTEFLFSDLGKYVLNSREDISKGNNVLTVICLTKQNVLVCINSLFKYC